MGEMAANLLIQKLLGKTVSEDQIVLPCNLVIRESTAKATSKRD
jgi:DNA-binding LacI/PurR family transcriptional regulator